MKITDIKLGHLRIPLHKPFKTALRTVTHVEDVLVKIYTDTGAVGYGSAAPTPSITGDTADSIRAAIQGPIRKLLTGLVIDDFGGLMEKLHAAPVKQTSAKAAVDGALYDLYGQLQEAPVYKLLGGSRKEFSTDITISLNEPEEMVSDSLDAVGRGFKTLKVKVGGPPEKDIERLKNIRDAVGDTINLRLDANQGWTPQEAVHILQTIEDHGIRLELAEQPVKGSDLKGLKFVTDHVAVPIVADESAFSPRDVSTIIRMRAADMINIKLMKTGGLYNALKICTLAEGARMECMIGCMMESRISVTAAAHLAGAKSIITRFDLDPPVLVSEDPIEGGALYKDDLIILSDEPGFGFKHIRDSKGRF